MAKAVTVGVYIVTIRIKTTDVWGNAKGKKWVYNYPFSESVAPVYRTPTVGSFPHCYFRKTVIICVSHTRSKAGVFGWSDNLDTCDRTHTHRSGILNIPPPLIYGRWPLHGVL